MGDGMSRQNNAAPVIIKRKKVVAGGGHHGGAWKVAYADFVTAMMAFFLMMWLLGATTESQRRGLADYFNPTIPLHRIASGGADMLGGSDLASRESMGPAAASDDNEGEHDPTAVTEAFEEVRQRLEGMGGESMIMSQALRHVITRVTDEGLVIELFDLPDAKLFERDTDTPTQLLEILAGLLGEALKLSSNALAIEGHVRSYTVVQAVDPRWPLSTARAARMQQLLEGQGLGPGRIARITGHADRRPARQNPMSIRNNRLEVILLRRQTEDR